MPAYAIANLSNVDLNADIVRYLQEIDDTLVPFGGRFLVHGVTPEVMEGPWADATVIIEFPDLDRARAWYASPPTWSCSRCAPRTPTAPRRSSTASETAIAPRAF